MGPTATFLLAHHHPGQHDRCVRVGGVPVCRRCIVLYPVALIAALVVVLLDASTSATWSTVAITLLPLPAVLEFVAEHLGLVAYRAARQVTATLPAAIGLGIGFAAQAREPGHRVFWITVLAYSALCTIALAVHHRRRTVEHALAEQRAHEDHPLTRGFGSAEEMRAYLETAEREQAERDRR